MWEIISGILGILGFVISLVNLIHYFLTRRMNLEIKIIEFALREYSDDKKRIFLHYQANNKSTLPIAITDIQLIVRGTYYNEDYNTHRVLDYESKRKDRIEYVPTYNDHLPITLPEFSSHAGYLVFVIPQDIAQDVGTGLTFQIRTNRCKELQKTFALNEWVTLRHIPLK